MRSNPFWYRLLFLLWPLQFIIKAKVHPENVTNGFFEQLSDGRDIVFVLPRMSFVDVFVLNLVLRAAGFPRVRVRAHPQHPRRASIVSLRPRSRLLFFPNREDPFTEIVADLIQGDPRIVQDRVMFLPVSIFWGMAPKKAERSVILRLLFPDDDRVNAIQKAWIVLVHCRNVHVHIGNPMRLSLGEVESTEGNVTTLTPRARLSSEVALQQAQKLRRSFLIEFSRERTAALGPSLYDFSTLVESVVSSPSTQAMLASGSEPPPRTIKQIVNYLNEISANYNYMTVMAYEIALDFIWTRIFKGIRVRNFQNVVPIARTGRIVWMPCHRSHVDYLLLSYILMKRGLVVPHIAAGINLNFWPIGSIFRRGGAFFLRRSFKGNRLYSYVFKKYVDFLMHNGFSIEFFQEGGRTRIGKLLTPKLVLLNICASNIVERKAENTYFVPVFFGYEKVLEGESYARELMGAKKQKESIFQLFAAMRKLFSNFGRVDVSFGTPIRFGTVWQEFFESVCPKDIALPPSLFALNENIDFRDPGIQAFVSYLARRVNQGVNAAASVSGTGLIAAVFLTENGATITDAALVERLRTLHWVIASIRRTLKWDIAVTSEGSVGTEDFNLEAPAALTEGEKAAIVPIPAAMAASLDGVIREAIEDARKWGFIEEQPREGKPLWKTSAMGDMQLWWYRGNIFHILAVPGLVSAILVDLEIERRTRAELIAYLDEVRKIWDTELYWPDSTSTEQLVDAVVGMFTEMKLVDLRADGTIHLVEDERTLDVLNFFGDLVRLERELYGIQLAAGDDIVTREEFFNFDQLVRGAVALHRSAFLRGAASQPASLSQVFGKRVFDALLRAGLFANSNRQGFRPARHEGGSMSRFFEVELWKEFAER